uniref:FAS1 domain-containing protein n=1 Tax=Chenopodium quinoa TaxID=63459 RepID=A0A803L5J6_CHEQI
MASRLIFSLLFLLLTFSITTTTTSAIDINFTTFNIAPTSSPSSPPSTPPPQIQETPLSPPAHIQETRQQQQFNAIIDSIVGAGDFSNWASLLSHADPSMFPLTATLFVLENGGNSSSPVDPLLFSYHIVPRRLTFSELRQLPNGARLPTLLPRKTLLITSNFSVNGVVISISP